MWSLVCCFLLTLFMSSIYNCWSTSPSPRVKEIYSYHCEKEGLWPHACMFLQTDTVNQCWKHIIELNKLLTLRVTVLYVSRYRSLERSNRFLTNIVPSQPCTWRVNPRWSDLLVLPYMWKLQRLYQAKHFKAPQTSTLPLVDFQFPRLSSMKEALSWVTLPCSIHWISILPCLILNTLLFFWKTVFLEGRLTRRSGENLEGRWHIWLYGLSTI